MVNLLSIFAITDALEKKCTLGHDFLGLVPWYHYLNDGNFKDSAGNLTCDIHKFALVPKNSNSDVPLVLLAVVDDLLRIAGIVAVAFVIVGAFKYVASQGNPEDTAKAQSTIINALIGMAVAIIAVGIVSFLGKELGG
jgi:hypothetical protein